MQEYWFDKSSLQQQQHPSLDLYAHTMHHSKNHPSVQSRAWIGVSFVFVNESHI